MKVIFLDIDGVLNSTQYWETVQNYEKEIPEMEFELSPQCIKNLKKIVDSTNAKIVVTSTWKRLKKKMEKFEQYIALYDLSVYDYTPCHPDGAIHRGEEIRQYLKQHKSEIKKFILIDDEEYPDFNELTKYLVKTDFYKNGLCREHVNKAIKMLGKEIEYEEYER